MTEQVDEQAGDTGPSAADAGASSDEEVLAALADDFASRVRRQEHPSVEEYIACHPRLAERIRKVLPTIALMEATRLLDPHSVSVEGPGSTLGRYRLMERIGEGGFGVVYLAEQLAPVRRKVALKVLKPGMDSRHVLARFEAERQALAIMDHPNIAKVLDAGATDAGRPYFVMELVNGVPITDFCDQHQLTPRQRLEMFTHVCQAVQHAHQKGIIHRDLKPSNVLVTMHDTRPVVKVIDFGIAKALGQELTEKTLFTGLAQLVGTPLYMSPEQAGHSGLDVDTRSDIYSLGVLLYELLTGTTPFDKERFRSAAQDEIRRIIREEEPPRPSTRLSESRERLPSISAQRHIEPEKLTRLVRGELDWIVMKALEKDRSRRYETANGFAADVQRYLANEPVAACPPTAGYRLQKFVRKHRGLVIASAAVALALMLGVIGTAVGLVRANLATEQERQAKVREAERADGERQAKLEAEARRLDAEARRREAEQNLAFARKGNEILGSVFDGLDPNLIAESGRPLQDVLRENLGEAVKQLKGSAIGDPLEVAEMQNRLGASLLGLGEYGLAIEVLGEAMETHQAVRGLDDPITLTSMNNLAMAYRAAGQLGQTLPLLEEALKRRQAKLGPDHPQTLTSMNNLGLAYKDAGRSDKALPLLEEAFKGRQAKLGPDHPDTLAGMNNLGLAFEDVGRSDKALPLLEHVLAVRRAMLGPDHPQTLTSLNNLGLAHNGTGRPDRGLPLLEEALKGRQARLGPDHPATLTSMNNLGLAYKDAGRSDKALPLLEQVLALRRAKLGPDHPRTLTSLNNLGLAYKDAGRPETALPVLEEALKGRQAKLGPDHPDTLASMHFLAMAHMAAGQPDRALPLFQEKLGLMKATRGPDHPETLAAMGNVAAAYWQLNRLDESIRLLEAALELAEANLGRGHRRTLRTAANLGANYKDAGRLQEAIPLLEEAYSASKEYPELRSFAMSLLDAYSKAGDDAKCTHFLDMLLFEARQAPPEDGLKLTELLVLLSRELLEQERWAEAEPPLRECLAIRQRLKPDAWSTFNTQSTLGGALLGQEKYAEAEPLLLQGYEGMKQREETIPPQGAARLPEAIDRLIELYNATNRPEEVKKWQAERAKLAGNRP